MVALKYSTHATPPNSVGERRNKNNKIENWCKMKDGYVGVNYTVLSKTVFENIHSEKVKINKIIPQRKEKEFLDIIQSVSLGKMKPY